jgi:hypothetical protein
MIRVAACFDRLSVFAAAFPACFTSRVIEQLPVLPDR